jgi:hypothetical protein
MPLPGQITLKRKEMPMQKLRFFEMAFAVVLLLATIKLVSAQSVVVGSTVNGTATNEAAATDSDYSTYMEINATGGPGNRVSFIVNLGGTKPVSSVGIYGYYLYNSSEIMLSDEIRVEAAEFSSGPWTQIGAINVGHTRPTDPNPAVGGENPFTGGNGRRIPCTPVNANYLRISGDQAFDNIIRICHLQLNPAVVIHRLNPINQGVTYNPFDFGGGADNSRLGVDMVDGKLNTRAFIGNVTTMTLDLGASGNAVQELRLLTSESDGGTMVETGVVKVSSTDNPDNMDTLETNFDASLPRSSNYGIARIALPNTPAKRFFQLSLLTNTAGTAPNGTSNTIRIGEIEYRTTAQVPVSGAAVLAGSLVNATTPGGSEGEAGAFDSDYNTYFQIDQGAMPTASFVISLGGSKEVHSLALYGIWSYLAAQMMFSDAITVEAGNSSSGPWTQIGSINVGNTKPTDPDPTVGGVNPFTGGNGRLIPCTSSVATHLRVSFGFGFDNHLRLYAAFVNAAAAAYQVVPVDQGQTLWDFGGGAYNSRVGVDLVDGNTHTRTNPRAAFGMVLDLGQTTSIAKIRFYSNETDTGALPTQGSIQTSSTDSPTNMDTTEITFNQTYAGGGVIEVTLPSVVNKRFVRVNFTQTGRAFSEIEAIAAPAQYTMVPVELSDFSVM